MKSALDPAQALASIRVGMVRTEWGEVQRLCADALLFMLDEQLVNARPTEGLCVGEQLDAAADLAIERLDRAREFQMRQLDEMLLPWRDEILPIVGNTSFWGWVIMEAHGTLDEIASEYAGRVHDAVEEEEDRREKLGWPE